MNSRSSGYSCTTIVQVLEGRGLAVKDLNGFSDPYCTITGIPATNEAAGTKQVKSEVSPILFSHYLHLQIKFMNLSPKWKQAKFSMYLESLTFNCLLGIIRANDSVQSVRVEVWDKDHDKADDFLYVTTLNINNIILISLRGYALINIDPYVDHTDQWIPLQPRSPADGLVTGDIRVAISRKGLCHKVLLKLCYFF